MACGSNRHNIDYRHRYSWLFSVFFLGVIKEIKKPPDLKEGKRVKQFLDLVNQRRSQGQSVVSSGGADVGVMLYTGIAPARAWNPKDLRRME